MYFMNLIRALLQVDKDNFYVIFANGLLPIELKAPNLLVIRVGLGGTKKVIGPFVQQLVIPVLTLRYRLDVIHSLFSSSIISSAGRCKKAVTVHDMVVYFRKEWWPKANSWPDRYYRTLLPVMLKRADGIIAVSEFTKSETIRYCKIEPGRISVVYEGPGVHEDGDQPKSSHPENYFLTISSDRPQKNLVKYIEAISLLPSSTKKAFQFIICGMIGVQSKGIRIGQDKLNRIIEEYNVEKSVVVKGFVSQDDLVSLYRNAFAVVFPSVYEGFGLPVLEAFHYERPLICSDAASLKEVGGDAPLYFDPNNPHEMASKIQEMVTGRVSRNAMIDKGKERLKTFSWHKCALETVAFYKALCTS